MVGSSPADIILDLSMAETWRQHTPGVSWCQLEYPLSNLGRPKAYAPPQFAAATRRLPAVAVRFAFPPLLCVLCASAVNAFLLRCHPPRVRPRLTCPSPPPNIPACPSRPSSAPRSPT